MSDQEEQDGAAEDATAASKPEAARGAAQTASTQQATAAQPATDGDGQEEERSAIGQDDIEELLRQAQSGVAEAAGSSPAGGADSEPYSSFELGELEPGAAEGPGRSLDVLGDVELDLRIELGRTMMRLEDVLQLRGGSVVVLDKLAGDPVDIFVNGRLVARGEVLVMNDNFCIRVTELAGAGP